MNAKVIEERIEQKLNQFVPCIGLVYFTDGSVNIIDGPATREQYADTVSSKSSLREMIGETISKNNNSLSQEQFTRLVEKLN